MKRWPIRPGAANRTGQHLAGGLIALSLAMLLAACSAPVILPEPSAPPVSRPQPVVVRPEPARPAPVVVPPAIVVPSPAPRSQVSPPPARALASPVRASAAGTPRDYRRDAAQHLYGLNRERVFRGRLPPLLYAVGVLQVEVDGAGQVSQVSWMRAPRHAPEVMAEIERTVRAAAPFPAPTRMGRVTYTDTWLWDKSGRFQLDTLTEGQR